MSSTFRAALVQLRSGRDVAANMEVVARLVREAKEAGAQYVQTPEMTSILERDRQALFAAIGTQKDDAALARLRELARETGVWLHVGSLAIRLEDHPNRAANRAFVIDPQGEIAASYDKIHMFDVDLPNGESYRESNTYQPGETAVSVDLPWGRLGVTICYDVRFPALHRALAETGSGIIAVPAAFTRQTGEAHWSVLLRARAIETGSFVLAAAQGGKHEDGRETYGHSIAIDPWGRVLVEGGTEPGVFLADIDLSQVAEARQRIPALKNGRRFGVVDHAPPPLREVAAQ